MATYTTPPRQYTTQPIPTPQYGATVTNASSGYKGPINTKPRLPVFQSADPLLNIQQNAQQNIPGTPNNGNPQGANNMSRVGNLPRGRYPVPQQPQPVGQNPSDLRRAYLNQVSGQQSDLGRYRPPTLAGNGNDPMNWNDYGGYDYNLPSAYGPTPNTATRPGPYGGYPTYLQPNWRNMLPGGG